MNDARIQAIKAKITAALNPISLEIIDDSARHYGHAGAKDGRGHFIIKIKAESLDNLSRINAHRMIYSALGDLMQTDIHALNIIILD